MHQRHCLKLADRIHTLLERELGQGIERSRLLGEPLYGRDVLLVCEALVATEGPVLARAFRRAAAAPDDIVAQGAGVGGPRWTAWFGLPQALAQALPSRSSSAPSAT